MPEQILVIFFNYPFFLFFLSFLVLCLGVIFIFILFLGGFFGGFFLGGSPPELQVLARSKMKFGKNLWE